MKKMVYILMISVLLISLTVLVNAEELYEYGDYEYTVLENGTIEITKYIGKTSTQTMVPDTIGGKTVTSIRERAFTYYGSDKLLAVSIPASVTHIGPFLACGKIYVDEGNAFYSNDKDGVLFDKDKTTLIHYPTCASDMCYEVPDTVERIESFAFATRYIEEVVLPETLISIGESAFSDCCFLHKLNLPESLKFIGANAISGCVGITEITLPENLESIGEMAINSCIYLDNIYVRSMNSEIAPASLNVSYVDAFGVAMDELLELYKKAFIDKNDQAAVELYEKLYRYDDLVHISAIYCHSGSTAETYAIENGVDYVLTHFFEGEWIYDYDNMIRYHKCIHCDEIETETLETTADGDVEIIEPADPNTEFIVDIITDYVIIEETISNNITTDFEIIKAFDINLKNKDGVHVQPDGTVKVKIPLDSGKEGNYKVYRVNDDGSLTDMNAYREGSHMVFDTDHFSVYAIIDESEKTDEPVAPDEPQEEIKQGFFARIIYWLKSFFELIARWFNQ